VLGSDWWFRRYDSAGNEVWKVTAPAGTCAANIAPDGKVAIAAFGDGTIRWYRYSDGKELAAFFPHADKNAGYSGHRKASLIIPPEARS